jgi:hypothetical protein
MGLLGLFKRQTIKCRQYTIPSNYPWLETIGLVEDAEAERLNDWTVGYYHCCYCDTYQGFTFHLPPKVADDDGETRSGFDVSAHNERTAFWHEHAHGDARVILLERFI